MYKYLLFLFILITSSLLSEDFNSTLPNMTSSPFSEAFTGEFEWVFELLMNPVVVSSLAAFCLVAGVARSFTTMTTMPLIVAVFNSIMFLFLLPKVIALLSGKKIPFRDNFFDNIIIQLISVVDQNNTILANKALQVETPLIELAVTYMLLGAIILLLILYIKESRDRTWRYPLEEEIVEVDEVTPLEVLEEQPNMATVPNTTSSDDEKDKDASKRGKRRINL